MKGLLSDDDILPLVVVWIGQFCRDVIGRQNVKVAAVGSCFTVSFDPSICMYRSVGFV